MPNHILYIACPPALREPTQRLLEGAGFETAWADDAAEALSRLEECEQFVLLDFDDSRAPQIAREVRERRPDVVMLAVADASRPETGAVVERSGIPAVLNRPLDARTLARLVGTVRAPAPRPAAGPYRSGAIVAESRAMKAILQAIWQASASDSGVLVCGESGSGRHALARFLHAESARAARAFVSVDCAEDDGKAIEARLFGRSEPGAGDGEGATDCVEEGSLLHQARAGTLFLANLPELPERVQRRLASVLRAGEARVGANARETPLRVRPIVSADAAWDAAVAEGRLRADLVHRVAALRIELPPLRERREDIPQLAAVLLREECEARRAALKELEPAASSLLSALPWRGNVRELRALMATLAAHVPAVRVRLEDVLGYVRLDGASRTFVASGPLREARERFEREYISAVVEHHRGRMGEAARELGIQRTNLYRKMRSLRVGRPVRSGRRSS